MSFDPREHFLENNRKIGAELAQRAGNAGSALQLLTDQAFRQIPHEERYLFHEAVSPTREGNKADADSILELASSVAVREVINTALDNVRKGELVDAIRSEDYESADAFLGNVTAQNQTLVRTATSYPAFTQAELLAYEGGSADIEAARQLVKRFGAPDLVEKMTEGLDHFVFQSAKRLAERAWFDVAAERAAMASSEPVRLLIANSIRGFSPDRDRTNSSSKHDRLTELLGAAGRKLPTLMRVDPDVLLVIDDAVSKAEGSSTGLEEGIAAVRSLGVPTKWRPRQVVASVIEAQQNLLHGNKGIALSD